MPPAPGGTCAVSKMFVPDLQPLLACLHLCQWPGTYLTPLSDWKMSCQPGLHMLFMVSDRGDNKGQWATHSLVKWLTSAAPILSWDAWIPLIFLYDIVKSVFLNVTKSRSDTTIQCSVTTELKYAILQWGNKDPVTICTQDDAVVDDTYLSGPNYPPTADITIGEPGVKKLLKGVNPSKASGPDQIPCRLLHGHHVELAPVFTFFFSHPTTPTPFLRFGNQPGSRQSSKKMISV